MRRIAIIPARGGSKRLPRKNLRDFQGRPIIAWTITAAQGSGCFDRIVVSTEDAEIANISRGLAAYVDQRPAELATDEATVSQVCLDLLEREEANGRQYDVMVCLYATAPLRQPEDIRAVVNLLVPGTCDFALAVTDFSHPPHQALSQQVDGILRPMWPDMVTVRTDHIGKLVVDNGSTYATSIQAFRRQQSFYGPGLRGHHMPRSRSVDIDCQDDLDLAIYFAGRLKA